MKRTAPRVPVAGNAISFCWTRQDGSEESGRVINIGPGGIAVSMDVSPPAGEEIEFSMVLGGNKTICGSGQVAWSSSDKGSGLCFVDLDDYARTILDLWLKQNDRLRKGG